MDHIMPPRAKGLLAALLAASAVAGCVQGPAFTAPDRPSAAGYTAAPATDFKAGSDPAQHLAYGQAPSADWWTALGSPELDRVVRLALANNQSLASARANLARVSEQARAVQGSLFPQVEGNASLAREEYGANFLGPQARTFPVFSAGSAGVTVSYDLDLFGGRTRSIELAKAQVEQQRQMLGAATLAVTGNVVVQSVQLAAARSEIGVVEDMLTSDRKTLDLVRQARAVGAVSDLDVLSAQNQLDHDETMLPPLRQRLSAAEDALAVLVGKPTSEWMSPAFTLETLALPLELPVTVPSELVAGRPDIRAAEAQLHAASAAVGVATANLYPHVTLSAAIAEEGLVGGVAGPAGSLVGGLAGPIFDGGALQARKRAAIQAYNGAAADYRQVVLASFAQVADALHALDNDASGLAAQQRALASAEATLDLTRAGYGAGSVGIVQMLDAQRQREQAAQGQVRARAQRFQDTVRLFLAMGGGVSRS
ncbi:MAG: transporter [Caulobacteraceae bacterium]|nr:transporter [Caulobacteraceae bacterium]